MFLFSFILGSLNNFWLDWVGLLGHAWIRVRVTKDLLLRVGIIVRVRIAIGFGDGFSCSRSCIALVIAIGVAVGASAFWRWLSLLSFCIRILCSLRWLKKSIHKLAHLTDSYGIGGVVIIIITIIDGIHEGLKDQLIKEGEQKRSLHSHASSAPYPHLPCSLCVEPEVQCWSS